MLERTRANHLFVRAIITGDLIRRDLQVASPWQADWDRARCVFKQLTMTADGKPIDRWVGYEVKGKGLHRREGAYLFACNQQAGGWGESTVSLVDTQVVQINLQPIIRELPKPTVVAVKVLITNKLEQHPFTVALRNRVLYGS